MPELAMTEPADPLPPPIRRRFAAPAHAGPVPAGAGLLLVGEAGDRAEGGWVRLELAVAAGRIAAARYLAYGCPWLIAAGDWLCERLEGQPAPPAGPAVGGPLDWARQLGVPEVRLTRLLLLEDALLATCRALPAGHTR